MISLNVFEIFLVGSMSQELSNMVLIPEVGSVLTEQLQPNLRF